MKKSRLFLSVITFTMLFAIGNAQTITTAFGNGIPGFSGDGGPAANAQVRFPSRGCRDMYGNTYICDQFNNRIRRVDYLTGIMTTVAGNGIQGSSGDGGLAVNARINFSNGVCVNYAGTVLYLTDGYSNKIRKVDLLTGIITTVAGNGTPGFSGDGGAAINATMHNPTGICIDILDNVYFVDADNYRIRRIDHLTGTITTVAGNGTLGDSGDSVLAVNAQFAARGVFVDASGNIYIADQVNSKIRKVIASTGLMIRVTGNGTAGFSGDGGLATNAQVNWASDVCFDLVGNIYIADQGNNRIRRIDHLTSIITTAAGNGTQGDSGDGGPAIDAQLYYPQGVWLDIAGNILFTDQWNHRIRKITPTTILPISLISFDAKPKQKTIETYWTTASQVNNNYFEVQSSIDQATWKSVGKVTGCGSCAGTMNYSLIDHDPSIGISYYQLKQVDFDGKFTFSKVVMVKIDNSSSIIMTKISTSLYSLSGLSPGMDICVFGIDGSLILKKVSTNSSFNIDMHSYPKGCYVVRAKEFSKKFINN